MDALPKRTFSYEEAAHYTGLSERAVRRLTDTNVIPKKFAGTKVLIELVDLDKYLDALPNERALLSAS